VTGRVDDQGRALLVVSVRHPAGGPETTFEAWVDTGFNGDLVLPRGQVATLGLPVGFGSHAVLANGSQIELETYAAQVDWFGELKGIEVIANDGEFPLLGVGLLRGHALHIDYARQTLTLN
jgi:clan AA aspartic protease